MFTLPKLIYQYADLDPYIDKETMMIHHTKHHQGYVDKLNKTLEGSGFETKSLEWLLKNLEQLPEELRTGVKNNGGGHYNHSFFWQVIGQPGTKPAGKVLAAINKNFGSMERFKDIFLQAALTRFGSGWAWLCKDGNNLHVCSTANQDNCWTSSEWMSCGMNGCKPILTLDVWEHAYYLKYQNKRDEYVKNFWQVVNWPEVEKKFMV